MKVNIYQVEQLRAIDGFLSNKPDFVYRKICRWFSKTFATPLMDVLKMPMPVILQHYYESEVEDADYNHMYELVKTEYLPEFMKESETADQAFADSLVEEQERTLKAKAERDKKKKAQEEADIDPTPTTPTTPTPKSQSLNDKPLEGSSAPVDEFDLDYGDGGDPDEE